MSSPDESKQGGHSPDIHPLSAPQERVHGHLSPGSTPAPNIRSVTPEQLHAALGALGVEPWTSTGLRRSKSEVLSSAAPPTPTPTSYKHMQVSDNRKVPKFKSPPLSPIRRRLLQQQRAAANVSPQGASQPPKKRRGGRELSQIVDLREKKRKRGHRVRYRRGQDSCAIELGDQPPPAPKGWRRHLLALLATVIVVILVLVAVVYGFIFLLHKYTNEKAAPPEGAGPYVDRPYMLLDARLDVDKKPCDNFYSFACGHFHPKEKRSRRHLRSFMEEAAHNKRMAMAELMRSGIGGTLSKSFQNMQHLYRACLRSLYIQDTAVEQYRAEIHRVTVSPTDEPPTWQKVVVRARNQGFDHNFFVNVSVVAVGDQPPALTVSPPLDLHTYNYIWQRTNEHLLVQMLKIVGNYSTDQLDETRAFAQALQLVVLQHYRSKTQSLGSTDSVTFEAEDWVEFLQRFTGDGVFFVETFPDYLPLKPYLLRMIALINRTDERIWLIYVNAMLMLRDCAYSPKLWRASCPSAVTSIPEEEFDVFGQHCINIAMDSPWFQGVSDAQYIQTFNGDSQFVAMLNDTATEMFRSVAEVATDWLRQGNWLNAIATSGAQHHLDQLQLSLGWCEPHFDMAAFETMYNSTTVQADLPDLHLLQIVHVLRQGLLDEHLLLVTRGVDYRRRYQICRPSGGSAVMAQYEAATHTIVVEPFSLHLLLEKAKVQVFATVGSWIGAALLSSLNFPDFRKQECIYPGTMWKYNLQMYRENHAICVERQYREYAHSFALTDVDQDLPAIVGNLSVLTGSNFAYVAYRKWLKEVDLPERSVVPAYNFTNQQLYWILWMTYRCSDENFLRFGRNANQTRALKTLVPDFVAMGPNYISEDFTADFGCDDDDRMVPSERCNFA